MAILFGLMAVAEAKPRAPKTAKPADIDDTLQGLHVRTEGVTQTAAADVRVVIEEQVKLSEDKAVSAPLADDLAFFVRQRYLELGFADATVEWDIAEGGAVLKIEEGPRYEVGEITFEGNEDADTRDLTRYLLRPTHEKLNSSSDHPSFVASDLKAGADLVRRYFQSLGFLEAKIDGPAFTPHPETSTQDVMVKITQGRRYDFGEIHVTGLLLGDEDWVHVRVEELRGQAFSEVKVENFRKDIVSRFQQRGHFAANATATANPAASKRGQVEVFIRVDPGPKFRITEIEADSALSRGARRLANAGFTRAVGRTYAPADLEVMHRHVLDSEVFTRLDVTPTPTGPDTLRLAISGKEAPTRRYAAYGGYETFHGAVIGAEARKVNVFDSGDAVRIKAEVSAVGLNGELIWVDPAIFNSAFSLESGITAESESIFDYERQSFGAHALLNRQWNRAISTRLFVEGSANKTSSDVLTPEELGPDAYDIGTVGIAAVFDYRNSPLTPTDGWYGSAGLRATSGGSFAFVRSDMILSVYQPITKRFRVAGSLKANAIMGESVKHVPIDLRLFNGGATTVRSFPEREMGQKSKNGTPLGGILSEVAQVEFSYEVMQNLELALFGDAGVLSPSDEFPTFELPDVRYAIGLGLRYKLPIGPLRIDYGVNPSPKIGEPKGALHISFGFAF